MGKYPALSFEHIRTNSFQGRRNLVTIENLANLSDPVVPWGDAAFEELVEHILEARRKGAPVIWSQGAHVIKCGLSRYLIALIKMGIITHIAGNGACSIHDFELAAGGGTSEDVPTAIEDGSFGMWEETGRWMNEAIQLGAAAGAGIWRKSWTLCTAAPRTVSLSGRLCFLPGLSSKRTGHLPHCPWHRYYPSTSYCRFFSHWQYQRHGFSLFLPFGQSAGSGSVSEFWIRRYRAGSVFKGAFYLQKPGIFHFSHYNRKF